MEYIKPATPRELFALRAIRLCLEAALWFMFVAAVVYCKASGFAGDLASDLDSMPVADGRDGARGLRSRRAPPRGPHPKLDPARHVPRAAGAVRPCRRLTS